MKIGYLSPGRRYEHEEGARRRRILESYQSGDLIITMLESDEGPATIETPEDEVAVIPAMVELARNCKKDFDAYIIGCAGDVGISELRKTVSIPVIGPARVSHAVAAAMYTTYGILAVNACYAAEEKKRIASMGLSDQVAAIEVLGIRVAEIVDYPERILRKIAEAARQCHVPAVVPACMSMAFLLAERDVMDIDGICIVNPLRCAIRFAVGIVA